MTLPVIRVDARDLICPLPVLRARRALHGAAPGSVIELLATDPAADADLRAFCGATGHYFLSAEAGPDHTVYRLKRAQ